MRTIWLGKLAMFVLLALFAGSAVAQTDSQDQGQFKQIKLSEKQVKDFISAQKELAPLASKLEGDAQDAALQEQVEKIAKSTGFSSLDEFEDVAANISLVLAGIDLQTGQFTEPPDQIKKEIDELKQDKQLSQEDKNKILAEMEQALKSAPSLQFKENVDLVKKYQSELLGRAAEAQPPERKK